MSLGNRAPHQGHERLGGAGHDLYRLYGDMLHFSDCFTQTVGAGGAAVNQLVVQEALARSFIPKSEYVGCRPGRA